MSYESIVFSFIFINYKYFLEIILNIKNFKTIKLIKSDWDKIIVSNNPFLNYFFFYYLEKSLCTSTESGWIPDHLVIYENNIALAIIPNFTKYNSAGEYVFDHSWANAYYNLGLNYYPKFLSAIPFTPINVEKIFHSQKINLDEIASILNKYLNEQSISSFHINFLTKIQCEIIEKKGFLKRIGIQYHWTNKKYSDFNDFLEIFRSKKKKNILKERKYLSDKGINIETKNADDINDEDINFFFNCYLNTIDKKWSSQYLNLEFFKLIFKSTLKKQMLLLIASNKKGKRIACALSFYDDKKLYGRYWGCIEHIPYLHFELCYYQSIDFAIKNRLQVVESGAQGEHKIQRGYEPTITYSNHWIKNSKIKEAISNFLEQESMQVKNTLDYLRKFLPFKKTN